MARTSKVVSSSTTPTRRRRKSTTPEGRENQLINMAMNCAEEQLENRTASSQVITHFLKLGTEKARLERQKLEYETELVRAKTEAIKSQQRQEELFSEAIKAMQRYRGDSQDVPDDDQYEY